MPSFLHPVNLDEEKVSERIKFVLRMVFELIVVSINFLFIFNKKVSRA